MPFKQIEIEEVMHYIEAKGKTQEELWEEFWKQHDKLIFGFHFQGYREVAECDPTEVEDYLDNLCERR